MENIIRRYERSFRENWDMPALSDYFTGETLSYGQMAEEIAGLHRFFEHNGIRKGDKVALCGRNTPRWVSIYIATITYGAVIVPILPDFNPVDLANIIEHSDSVMLFVDKLIWNKLAQPGTEIKAGAVIDTDSGTILRGNAEEPGKTENGFGISDVSYPERSFDDVMIISYTSGTSGFSKGVMLTVGNISANVDFAIDHKFHFRRSRVLGILPLAHAYGCAFDMLTPLATGSHITLLGKTPTPTILLSALAAVRPHLICTVPLVLEKIVRKKVLPQLESGALKSIAGIPLANRIVYSVICHKMLKAFGGCVKEINTGGAALSRDVESFLRKIRFPFTVGYGMTECGPLIAYEDHKFYKPGSCGRILPGMEIRIDRADGSNKEGEILVRGRNVMKGYYKNEDATSQAIDAEGWLHTGDMGTVDSDGTIYIKGRCKSMILSGNGQNIYPEEIEHKLNEMPYVAESLIYQEKGRLVALIVPDETQMKADEKKEEDLQIIMDNNLKTLNSLVASYEQVSEYKLCESEFEKTPKRSIRRYLYPMKAILKAKIQVRQKESESPSEA